MPTNTQNKISTWTLWSPLKFAFTTIGLLFAIMLIYGLGLHIIGDKSVPPTAHITILSCIAFIFGITLQIRSLPREKISQRTFIEIQNAQTILTTTCLIISGILLIKYQLAIIAYIISLTQFHPIVAICFMTFLLIFYTYLVGVMIANLYAKISRMHTMNIPMWKILFSIPFGFTALWIPGYLLSEASKKSNTGIAKSKWYTSVTNWIISRPTYTALAFVITTLLYFYTGLAPILLTFAFALICGIWTVHTGTKNFIKNIGTKYSTFAVIINWAIILIMIIFKLTISQTVQNVEINTQATYEITIQ